MIKHDRSNKQWLAEAVRLRILDHFSKAASKVPVENVGILGARSVVVFLKEDPNFNLDKHRLPSKKLGVSIHYRTASVANAIY